MLHCISCVPELFKLSLLFINKGILKPVFRQTSLKLNIVNSNSFTEFHPLVEEIKTDNQHKKTVLIKLQCKGLYSFGVKI